MSMFDLEEFINYDTDYIYEEQMALYNSRIWVTKNDKELHISAMKSSHIQNCINMLKKSNWFLAKDYIKLFKAELSFRQCDASEINLY